MQSTRFIFLIIVAVSLTSNFPCVGQILFQDDFNDGNDNGWTVTQGTWDVVNGTYHSLSIGQQVVSASKVGDAIWSDYIFEVDFKATRGNDKVFFFRCTPGKEYGMNIRSNNLGDGGLIQLVSSEKGEIALVTNYDTPRNQWYHLKVVLQGERIQVYIDNILKIDHVDVGTTILNGGIRLSVYAGGYGECEMYYDNVKITSICNSMNVPKFYQYDPVWASEIYDHAGGVWKPKDKTIKRWGCALTSSVMLLRYYGVTTGPDGQPTNPKNLNSWLKTHGGYTQYGALVWGALKTYSKGKVKYIGAGAAQSVLDSDLNGGKPVMVNLSAYGGHFVVATGKSNCSTYDINDPLSSVKTNLSHYGNSWLGLRRFQAFGQAEFMITGLDTAFSDTSIAIVTHSYVELLLLDSLGQRVGYDQAGDSIISEIPNGSYYTDYLGPESTEVDSSISDSVPIPPAKVLFIDIPSQGNYSLHVIGFDSNNYSLEFYSFPGTDTILTTTLIGSVDSGSVDTTEFRFSEMLCLAKPGDANGDGNVNLADIIFKVNYVFKGGPSPSPLCRGDVNASGGNPNLGDIIYLVNYVFKGGPPPIKSGACCL